jgi:NHLM bacteriocin system ABC transporter peptidase/ATP-binding protein
MAPREQSSKGHARRGGRRVRTPTTLQMEGTECGAASLAMVLAYHGRHVALQELRVACGVSRDGSKASNIVAAAQRYGLACSAYKLEPEDLDELDLPVILHWNFNHFLVYEGRSGAKHFVNDPANGQRVVTDEDMQRSFTGVALSFETTEAFVAGGRRTTLLDVFFDRLPSIAGAVAFLVLANLAIVLPGLALPTIARVFVDDVLIANRWGWLPALLAGLMLTAGIRAALSSLSEQVTIRTNLKLAVVSTSGFLWQMLRLPVQFYSARFAGDLVYRVNANARIAQVLSSDLVTGLVHLVSVLFFAVLLAWYDLSLTLIVVANAAISMVVMRFFTRQRVAQSTRLQTDQGKLAGVSMSGLRLIESLKASGAESDFFARWSGYQARVTVAEQALAVPSAYAGALHPLFASIGSVSVLAVGALHIMDGALTIGGLVAFQTLAASFLGPFQALLNVFVTLQEAEGDVSRLEDVMLSQRDPQVDLQVTAEDAPLRLSGTLSMRDVSFGYSPLEPPLIQGFSLELSPGKRVALVGGSGSGKSTLAKLISGLYEPWEGEILFDGLRRMEIPRHLFVNSVAVVDQDIFLFEGTVRENLTLWDDAVPSHAVVAAATDAAVHEDIVSRPGGYDALVEEGGRNFSGGQRQRMEIARALVVSPTLLLLDEATSALDPTTEKIVDDNLRRRGVACVIVAHRLSTVRDCDEIIVLEAGRVVERGTHDSLIAQQGVYANFVALDLGERS